MVLMLVVLPTGFAAAQDNLTIYFLDVGQADAAILQCGDDVMMIDGGKVKVNYLPKPSAPSAGKVLDRIHEILLASRLKK